MNKTCNIYYNRLTRKWEFYEVSKNGEESLFHGLLDLKGLEEGDGTKISWEHLVEIKRYFNLSKISINIYEDTPELIADIQNHKDESIHIKILHNEFIRKKAKEIEALLRDCFPDITLAESIKGEDEEDIRCLKHVVSSIKSIVESIGDRESRVDKISTALNDAHGMSNTQQYKEIIERKIHEISQQIHINSSIKENIEFFFNKDVSNEFNYDHDVFEEFLKQNLKTVEKWPVLDTSNLTVSSIRLFAKELFKSMTLNPIMRTSANTVFGINAIGIIALILYMLHHKKKLDMQQLQTIQQFKVNFCKELKKLMNERQSSLMHLICICPIKEAYEKLGNAQNIIDTLL